MKARFFAILAIFALTELSHGSQNGVSGSEGAVHLSREGAQNRNKDFEIVFGIVEDLFTKLVIPGY